MPINGHPIPKAPPAPPSPPPAPNGMCPARRVQPKPNQDNGGGLIAGAILGALLLGGCKTAPTTPVLPDAYEAPRVDCTLQQTADAPPWPTLWWLDGPAYTITVLGILAQERDLRGREHACIETHKGMGIIR